MQLTARYDDALTFAADVHRDQLRKGTGIPYLAHLLAVSSLILEDGGDEEQAIAGLLHDSLEDHPERTSYGDLVRRYGSRVADIVRACSDSEELPKPPWRARKEAYLAHLDEAPPDVLRVSRADKLHNARAILADLRAEGASVWSRFKAGPESQLWYYGRLAEIFGRRLPGGQTDELQRVVAEIERIAAD
jgi:(p)ppGpp synthase/HD superfamily hydrolase